MEFLQSAIAFLMALFITIIPYKGIKLPVLETEEDNCKLNVAMMSDVHIEQNEIFKKLFLKSGLKNISRAQSPIDAILIDGDLTNYADEESLSAFYEIIKNYAPEDVSVIIGAGNHDIGHAGDRDVTDISREEALANVIKYHNEYYGDNSTSNYFSMDVNGYKFIMLGDEVVDGGRWDAVTMTEAQLNFLDEQLAEGTKEGKPVFVCSHWPFDGINGEDIIYDDSGTDETEYAYKVKEIMEKYKNVFYISGHMHGGIRSTEIGEKYNMPMAEVVNGVTYISLPCFGFLNWYGVFWSGTGAQLEVYEDKVLFRPVNYLTGNWYVNSEYTFELIK